MPRIVVLTGGGIKGAVAAARCAAGNELILLHADYGQPSAPAELDAVRALSASFPSSSVAALCLSHVPELQRQPSGPGESTGGHGAADVDTDDATAPTTATLRGLMPVLLSVGVQCALRTGASSVVTGLSRFCNAPHLGVTGEGGRAGGWHEFLYSFNLMLEAMPVHGPEVQVDAPLLDVNLPQAIGLAQRFGVPLTGTWTCQRAGPRPCGQCEPCGARAQAFIEATVVDPLSTPAPAPAPAFAST